MSGKDGDEYQPLRKGDHEKLGIPKPPVAPDSGSLDGLTEEAKALIAARRRRRNAEAEELRAGLGFGKEKP
ncbi:MAG: hypothetical protein KKH04_05925 [Proteobacteria bacterium]|nr:hypothetical protein [Pseudomonadota bacterium]